MIRIINNRVQETCCFIGHRTIDESEELKKALLDSIERLITEKSINTFLFGSRSRFDTFCLELVTQIKEKHPHIKRIYVRAEFPIIRDDYKSYLLNLYDDTFYPEKALGAGKGVYVKRNYEMIDKSRFCIFYYDEKSLTANKSGTKTALDYAAKRGKEIIIINQQR